MRRIVRATAHALLGIIAVGGAAWLGPVTPSPADAAAGRLPGAPAQSGGPGFPLQMTEPHLASFIALDINDDYGVTLVVEPQTSQLPLEAPGFLVLNKWTGLKAGLYSERVLIYPDDRTEPIYVTGTEFRATEGSLSLTVVEAVLLDGFSPGLYWLAVELNGRRRTHYPFLVVSSSD